MSAATIKINDLQRAVLSWIGEGCPDGIWEGSSHRVSAAALRSRDLVRIRGRGPTWHAELTERGTTWLAELDERPTADNGNAPRETPDTAMRPDASSPPGTPDRSGRPDPQPSKTEQLVADVIAAGGTLLLPDDTAHGGINWRQRAYAAQRAGKVPAGKHLFVSLSEAGFEIALRDGETGNELGADPVPVPARVRNYHPAVAEFRDRTSLHRVSRTALYRASRIAHGLATALELRGHRVTYVVRTSDEDNRRGYGYTATKYGRFLVTINGHELAWNISENGVDLRGPWEEHKRKREEDRAAFRFDRWDYGRIEPYDKGATGQLELAILDSGPRQTKWGDRKRWTLESRLPQALRELETLAVEAEQRRVAREQREAERRMAWEAAMQQAKSQAIEAYHVDVLTRQVAAWDRAESTRAYCDAVVARHDDAIEADPAAVRWIAFARAYADKLQALPRMPEDPELRHEDLKPYLGGWSPYGP